MRAFRAAPGLSCCIILGGGACSRARFSPVQRVYSMSFQLDQVVPWGRSFAEYAAMFALAPSDLAGRILGCADGPASFNAELSARGGRVVSADPLYVFTPARIGRRIDDTYKVVMEQLRRNADAYVWETFRSPGELGAARLHAMRRFLDDLPAGARAGRYVAAALPRLPFADSAFDLALCSHYLFLYSACVDFETHFAAIGEMCRVAAEVRIFPLLDLAGAPSLHVEPVRAALEKRGFAVSIERVPYEFQRGGNHLMRVRRPRGGNCGTAETC